MMLLVPAPAVIVPLLIVHTYLSPDTFATEAVFPVEAEHTTHGVLMAGLGQESVVIGTNRVPLDTGPQPFGLVTDTERDTLPVFPAV
jgi:hypothetical protein